VANINAEIDVRHVFQGPAVMYIGQDGQTPTMVHGVEVDNVVIEPRVDDNEWMPTTISSEVIRFVSGGTYITTAGTSGGGFAFESIKPIAHNNTVRLCKQGIITADTAKEILGYLPDELKYMEQVIDEQDKPIRIIRTD